MSDNYLSLDWRNGPPPKEIIHRLEQVFTDVDDPTKSGTALSLSQSTTKAAHSVVERNGHPMVMRHDNSGISINGASFGSDSRLICGRATGHIAVKLSSGARHILSLVC